MLEAYLALFPGADRAHVEREIAAGRIVGDSRGFGELPADIPGTVEEYWIAAVLTCP